MQMKSSNRKLEVSEEQKEIQEINKNEEEKEVEKKMGKLKCVECGLEQDLPMHCGQAMHQEGDQLVCWMGASCGAQSIPEHHGKTMEIV